MDLFENIGEPEQTNCNLLCDRAILVVEPDPLAAMAIRIELRHCHVLNPVHRLGTVEGLMCYMQGRGVYTDRDLFSYPAVVLLSAALPSLGATCALTWMRTSLLYRKMPIVVIGDQKHQPIMETAIKFGANTYITNPFDGREFHCVCRLLRLPIVFGA